MRTKPTISVRWLGVALTGGLAAMACSAPGGPDAVINEFGPPPDGGQSSNGSPDATTIVANYICTPATSSEDMPPRSTITSQMARQPVQATMFTSDLFERFSKVCGGCHVQNSLGGFVVSAATFKAAVTDAILTTNIVSDNPAKFMPPLNTPNGMPYSSRAASDS